MRPLFTLSARFSLFSCGLVFSVTVLGAFVRLLPWLLAKEVPLGTSAVFARALAGRGAEIALLVGFPVGAALAAAIFVERGEARALAALGARPSRLAAGVVPLAFAAVFVSGAVARASESTTAARFAATLVRSGRAACWGSPAPRRIDVPLVSLSWLCFSTGPRFVGAALAGDARLWFSGGDLRIAPDQRAVVVDDLRIAGAGFPAFAPRFGQASRFSIHAASARVAGLPGWPPPQRLAGALRGVLTGVVAAATALASVWAVLRVSLPRPIWAAAAAGASALSSLAVIRALDDGQAGMSAYLLAVPSGALVALLLQAAIRAIARSRIAGRKA